MTKILIDKATVKLVLDALEKNTKHLPADFDYHFEAITAIKEALAQPEQEPVADGNVSDYNDHKFVPIPLYTLRWTRFTLNDSGPTWKPHTV